MDIPSLCGMCQLQIKHMCVFVYKILARQQYNLLQEEVNELPVNVSVQGLTPANRLEVPKSEIFKTPL